MSTDGPPTKPVRPAPEPIPLSAKQAAKKQAAEDASAAAQAKSPEGKQRVIDSLALRDHPVGTQAEEEAGLNDRLAEMTSHPAFAAEDHEPAAYLNMLAGAIQNQRTGRHFLFSFPKDMTVLELFEVIGWMSSAFRQEIEKRWASGKALEGKKPELVLARAMPDQAQGIKS